MDNKTRRNYDPEFKRNAAALYVNGTKSLTQLTLELGVSESTLYNWVSKYKKEGDNCFEPTELSAHEKEILALKKELSNIAMERDILKKAIAIFSKKK
jgi:transposase-like protein